MVVLSSDSPDTLLPEMKNFGLEGIFNDMVINAYHKEEGVYELIKRNNFDKKILFLLVIQIMRLK